MLPRVVLLSACCLAIGGVAAACAEDEPSPPSIDCAFRSKCPNEIQRTKPEIDACNAEKADPKCGGAFSEKEACIQANEECLPNGKVNHDKLDRDCRTQIAAYDRCRPGGPPDASSSD
jgi:hypothetical protein